MIPARTIWFAIIFWGLESRSAFCIHESFDISSLRMRVLFPLRSIFFAFCVWAFSRSEKESRTLEISREASPLRAESFFKCLICACVSDIFLYNMPVLYKYMMKIKDIHERIHKNPDELAYIELGVAKRIFALTASLYFTFFLATIGWFYLSWLSREMMSQITFHMYSIFVIVSLWFWFSLCQYYMTLYSLQKKLFQYILLGVFSIIGLLLLIPHISKIF